MPFTHVASGLPRQLTGGLKSPTRQSRSGDRAPPLPCIDGFTVNPSKLRVNGLTGNPSRLRVNGFTLNKVHREGFTVPVNARQHGRSRKPFRMRRYEKCARKSFEIRTYKNKGLKVSWNEQLQKTGGYPPCFLASAVLLLLSPTKVHNAWKTSLYTWAR